MFQTKEISLFNYCSIKIDNKKKALKRTSKVLSCFTLTLQPKKKKLEKEIIMLALDKWIFGNGPTFHSHTIMIVQTKGTSIIAHARAKLKTWPHDAPRILNHCQPNDRILELYFQVTIFDQF